MFFKFCSDGVLNLFFQPICCTHLQDIPTLVFCTSASPPPSDIIQSALACVSSLLWLQFVYYYCLWMVMFANAIFSDSLKYEPYSLKVVLEVMAPILNHK
jgi:hypothetical protein